jgi:hypothetical protein
MDGDEYVDVVGALVIMTVLEPPLGLSAGCDSVELWPPPNLPESVYEPPGSVGVTVHKATPFAFVVAVQLSVPFSVSVTGSFATGTPAYVVSVPVSVVGAPYVADDNVSLTIRVVGVCTAALEDTVDDP